MRDPKFVVCGLIFSAFPAMAAEQGTNSVASAKLAQVVPIQDKIVTYLIDNGPKLLGAVLITFAGFLAARWLGALTMRWLLRRDLEPPVRMLITRLIKLLVVAFAMVIALGTMGVNIMAAVTGIGVVGVGVSLAM